MGADFYGLAGNPFSKQFLHDKQQFESNDHREMMGRLDFLKDARGVGVFTAAPGMGKSFSLHCFERSLNHNLYDMKYICLSTVSVGEFYKELCGQLALTQKAARLSCSRRSRTGSFTSTRTSASRSSCH